MGGPMAVNLARTGHDLRVFDVRAEPIERLVALGAGAAQSVADLAAQADIVMTVVVDETQADAVLIGTEANPGVLGAARRGTVVLVHSTIGSAACRRLGAAAAQRGIDLLDAPITGGPSGARDGTLGIMVGGDLAALERCRAVLAAVSSEVIHVGEIGTGQLAKLANNMVLATTMQAVHEALLLAGRSGLGIDTLLRVLGSGAGSSWVVEHWHDIGASSRGYPGGADGVAALTYKDLALALAEGHRVRASLPVTALTAQRLAEPYLAAEAAEAAAAAVAAAQ